MSRPANRHEKNSAPGLPILPAFLDYEVKVTGESSTGKRTNPFNIGKRIDVYTVEELEGQGNNAGRRVDWFKKRLLIIAWLNGGAVPYIFKCDGKLRSLDAGCLKAIEDEVDFRFDDDGHIHSVIPKPNFLGRFPEELIEKLMNEATPLENRITATVSETASDLLPLNPHALAIDERARRLSEVVLREGAQEFRAQTLRAWAHRCAVTGCSIIQALEAAHISPYKGKRSNHVCNGISLRRDLHRLFDLLLLSIEESRGQFYIRTSCDLVKSNYEKFNGQIMIPPIAIDERPDANLLACHFERFQTKEKAKQASI